LSQFTAFCIGVALRRHDTTRPVFVRLINPASDNTSICFMTAGSDTENGRASSLTDRLDPSPSCANSARRVGSDKAAKVRLSVASLYLTIWFSI
jgi:hypothetical protein